MTTRSSEWFLEFRCKLNLIRLGHHSRRSIFYSRFSPLFFQIAEQYKWHVPARFGRMHDLYLIRIYSTQLFASLNIRPLIIQYIEKHARVRVQALTVHFLERERFQAFFQVVEVKVLAEFVVH